LTSSAAANKKIALSFDDGPDPKWTPKILDVLKQKNVPGVFFVIGNMATSGRISEARVRPKAMKLEIIPSRIRSSTTPFHAREIRWQLNLTERPD